MVILRSAAKLSDETRHVMPAARAANANRDIIGSSSRLRGSGRGGVEARRGQIEAEFQVLPACGEKVTRCCGRKNFKKILRSLAFLMAESSLHFVLKSLVKFIPALRSA